MMYRPMTWRGAYPILRPTHVLKNRRGQSDEILHLLCPIYIVMSNDIRENKGLDNFITLFCLQKPRQQAQYRHGGSFGTQNGIAQRYGDHKWQGQ